MTPNLLKPSGQHLSELENPAGRYCHLGAHQENPLSLLGQYSDDELDEEGSKETKHAAVQESKPSVCADGQVANFLGDLQTSGLLEKQLNHVKSVSEESVIIEHSNLDVENSVCVDTDEVAKMETVTNAVEQSSVTKDSNESILPDFTAAQTLNSENIENEWKAVLHEESGRYYYWNIRTGETTWDAPSNMIQEVTESAEERNQSKVESLENAHLELSEVYPETQIGQEAEPAIPGIQEDQTCTSILADIPDPSLNRHQNGEQKEIQEVEPGFQLDQEFKEGNQEIQLTLVSEKKIELNDMSGPGEEFGFKESVPHNSASSQQVMEGDVDNNEMKNSEEDCIERLEPNKGERPKHFEEDRQDATPNPFELLKWSEKLSQRFKALEGTGDTVRASNLRLRYAVEAEIRLADCKALCSCGDSLEQFWSHTQAQLKRLESVLGVEEAAASSGPEQCRLLHSRHMSSTSFSSLRHRIASKTMSQESGRDEKVKMATSLKNEHYMPSHKDEECVSPPTVANHMPQNDEQVPPSQNEECKSAPEHERFADSPKQEYTLHDTSNDLEEGEIRQSGDSKISEVAGSVISSPYRFEDNNLKKEADPFVGLKATESLEDGRENEDMEVDMEVDDQNMPDTSVGPLPLYEEVLQAGSFTLSLPSTVAAVSTGSGPLFPISTGDDVWGEPPPLPEEDWAPPPPPDSESIPPPPPDEPPPSPLPPAVLCNGYEASLSPPLPYTEQYNSVYVPMPGYDYYQSTTSEAANPDYCVQANTAPTDGIQMSYYEQTASVFPESSDLNNPVEGVVYYEAPSNTISDSLGLNNHDCPPYYEQAGPSTFIENSGIHMDGKHVGGPIVSITAFTGSSFGNMGTGEVASTQISTCVASSSSVSTTGVVPPMGDGTTGATSTAAPKNLSKVVRTKKRTVAVAPTLRSNKKVSNMVDKWKAAKEELHGSDDDESERAYEAMEKKRQREIEEWRMQQIASGEAQDNANFQPLGGDWRERVKRRKAEVTVEENKPQSALVVDNVASEGASERKKPDLVELSKDLPPGWQAFWDESSGEVYYGNLTTSETTWDRPKGSG